MRHRLAQRPIACLLALAVFAAQAACACRHAWAAETRVVGTHVASSAPSSEASPPHACCKHERATEQSTPVSPPADPLPTDRAPAPGCPHCDGSAALKSIVPSHAGAAVDLSPALFFVLPFEPVTATPTCLSATADGAALAADSRPPSTLLALRCALTL